MESLKLGAVAIAFAIIISGCLGGSGEKNANENATVNVTENVTEISATNTAKIAEESEILNITEYSEILKSKIPIECQATIIRGSGEYSNYASIAIRALNGKIRYKTMASAYGGRGGYSETEGIYLSDESIYYVKMNGVDLQGKACEWQKFPAYGTASSGAVEESFANSSTAYACGKGTFDEGIFFPEGSVCDWQKAINGQNAKSACAQITDERLRMECEQALG